MKIIIKDDYGFKKDIEVDVRKNHAGKVYEKGSMICCVAPWESSGCPLTLNIAITPSGEILFRSWDWNGKANNYLHTDLRDKEKIEVTEAMIDTINGIFSGRILVEGIKIAVGKSVQEICPIDVRKEEELLGKTIYLNC